MEITDFSDPYKKLSNKDLLEILENPSHYQPIAIEAANNELNNRQLSPEAFAEAYTLLHERNMEQQLKDEKKKETLNKFRATGDLLYDTVIPYRKRSFPRKRLFG